MAYFVETGVWKSRKYAVRASILCMTLGLCDVMNKAGIGCKKVLYVMRQRVFFLFFFFFISALQRYKVNQEAGTPGAENQRQKMLPLYKVKAQLKTQFSMRT